MLTPKEKRSKWDPKTREGLFMGYEERSKAYRIYDIDADRMVISRDVTFDETTVGFSPATPQEVIEDTAMDFDAMDINEGPGQVQYQQTGKRKNRADGQDQDLQWSQPARHGAELEEASGSDNFMSRQAKRRPSVRVNLDEEQKKNEEDDDDSKPPAFWQASANTVEGGDLSEPTTFEDAVGGPDQVH